MTHQPLHMTEAEWEEFDERMYREAAAYQLAQDTRRARHFANRRADWNDAQLFMEYAGSWWTGQDPAYRRRFMATIGLDYEDSRAIRES